MKWLFETLARLIKRQGNAASKDPSRNLREQTQKTSRGFDDFPMIMLIIGALLLTLQQAEALDARRSAAAVGDQIVFRPGLAAAPGTASVISARVVTGPWAPPARSCRLNMPLITHHWGAFTVLAVRADGVMLSWAGGATAKGGNNCAPAHKLLVSNRGFVQLLSSERNTVKVIPK